MVRAILLVGAAAAIGALSTLPASAKELILLVPGIPGPYCAYGVEKRLLELEGVERVETLWDSERIRIITRETIPVTAADIKRAVSRADYPYKYEIRMSE
jgi:hypothetical protein